MSESKLNNTSANNKRIAKNTLALYFRTFITMAVGVYTSRIMLQALGIENYGINAVVGGIVSMSALITATMSQAISRYLTYGLGKGDSRQLRVTFSTAVSTQIIMSAVVILALETVGLWFLNNEANIPDGRMGAANWVLQCSIVTLVVGLISTPYNAIIIAYERMNVYAYTSIIEAVLKLIICFAIMVTDSDRLIVYAILQVCVGVAMRIFYGWYCGKNFDEAHYSCRVFDKKLLMEITKFSGWSLFSSTSWVLNTQGVNMLINVFFGVIYNAAQGIATTINSCIEQFVTNFTIAFNPQITKMYAAEEYENCYCLVNRGSRFAWMLMIVFIVPIFIEADQILSIWLVEVPEMTSIFLRFTLFNSLAIQFSQPLHTLIQAHGDIKRYSIESCLWGCLIFPLTWLLYLLGAPVWSTYPIAIVIRFFITFLRLLCLNRMTTFDWRGYVRDTINPCVTIIFLAFSLPVIISHFWEESLFRFFTLIPLSVIWVCLVCYYIGLKQNERLVFVSQIKK